MWSKREKRLHEKYYKTYWKAKDMEDKWINTNTPGLEKLYEFLFDFYRSWSHRIWTKMMKVRSNRIRSERREA